jgi:hypothetical protein
MSKLRKTLVAGALTLSLGGTVHAAPLFEAGDSSIFFRNFENLYRSVSDCDNTNCLPAVAGDPPGYRRVNPAVAGNVRVGDIFAGILDVQNVESAVSGLNTYDSSVGDRFTGYFAQRVAAITPAAGTIVQISLGTVAADPFGKLGAGEMFRLYSNVPSFTTAGGTDVTSGINQATAGTFWGSLGLGLEGYAYTRTDFSTTINSSNTQAFLALDLILAGAGYNAGLLGKLNDFNEDIVGGTIANPPAQVCSAAEILTPGIACTDFVGTSEIEPNSGFGANSPWMFASNDPFDLHRIPEPGTLLLTGVALAAMGLRRRRLS